MPGVHHDDIHGLRRQRDPHGPELWAPRQPWDKFDVIFAVILALCGIALVALIVLL